MNFMQNRIRSASIRSALACTTALLATGIAQPLFAQNLSIESNQTTEPTDSEIIITGSRIRGAAPVGSPVIAVGRSDFEESASVTVDRMLKELPQVFDLGVSENSRGQGAGPGNMSFANSINLRGLGAYSTLVLLDGHRVINNSRSTDPSFIPTLGVERIEIIPDGASAIYGSDAVAGVVNIIPRRSLDGIDVTARYQQSEAAGYHDYRLGAAFGKVWDGGQIMAAYEHVYRSNLSGDDRSYFTADQRAYGGGDYRSGQCNPGTIVANGITYAIPQGGVTQANAAALVPGTLAGCDTSIGQDLFPESEYDSANLTFTQRLTEGITFFADGFFTRREYVRQPAYFTSVLNVPETNAFFVRPSDFTGTSYQLRYSFIDDLPQNTQTGVARSWEVTPGLRFALPGGWELETLITYGESLDTSNATRLINNPRLNAALADSNPLTAFDPYGLNRTSPSVLASLNDQQFLARTENDFTGYEARLNGELFDLPGGAVRLALGYEGQESHVGLGTALGTVGNPLTYTYHNRRIDSAYGEALIPIVSGSNASPGFEALTLNLALRYDHYSDVGSTTNPKIGINYSPVAGVQLRGSYGTSFRAPIPFEISSGVYTMMVQTYQNPAGGLPIDGIAVGGPPDNLRPETATTWSLGLDIEASNRLRFSSTFFHVKYVDQIYSHMSNLTILSQAADFAPLGIVLQGEAAHARVQSFLDRGGRFATPVPGGDFRNVNWFIDGRATNLGQSTTEGIDFAIGYQLPTDKFGNFSFDYSGTYFTRYESSVAPGAPKQDELNLIFRPLKFKSRFRLGWDLDPVRVRATWSHVGGYTNNIVTPVQAVKAYDPIDLAIDINIGGGGTGFNSSPFVLTLEANNVFDQRPPYVNLAPSNNSSGGFDSTAASPIGRAFAVGLRKSFR